MSRKRRAGPPVKTEDRLWAISDEDRRLFEQEMRDVRPLRPGPVRVTPGPPPRGPRPRVPPSAARPGWGPAPELGPRRTPLEVERLGEEIKARADGVPAARLRALRAGEIAPEARLDLHGARRDEAALRLGAFLRGARARGCRCVLVVHGRGLRSGEGGPVLPAIVADELAADADVLAFVSAPPAFGGAGATLILLRR